MSPMSEAPYIEELGVPRASGDEPDPGAYPPTTPCVPRASGDEPGRGATTTYNPLCSPRERG